MAFFLSIYAFGILGFIIHLFLLPAVLRTKSKVIELLLLYQIVFSLGLTSLVAFFGLTFLDQYIADFTGWTPCPFQQQLANVNLAFGCLGILSIWYRNGFWFATVLGFSIWILSDGIQHLFHYIFKGNATAGNIGVPLWTDFLVPIFLLILLFLYRKSVRINRECDDNM
jgi:hypothetical protein